MGKLKHKILKDQAAYQKGRSTTTEQVFALKTLVEKAITSQNYIIIITMINMSAAFDTVSRCKLMNETTRTPSRTTRNAYDAPSYHRC